METFWSTIITLVPLVGAAVAVEGQLMLKKKKKKKSEDPEECKIRAWLRYWLLEANWLTKALWGVWGVLAVAAMTGALAMLSPLPTEHLSELFAYLSIGVVAVGLMPLIVRPLLRAAPSQEDEVRPRRLPSYRRVSRRARSRFRRRSACTR